MTAPNITTIDATTTVTTTVVVPAPEPELHTETIEETPEEKEQRMLTHQLLARQLEYYFSTSNLSRDTYLSTLRDLNDSYVPVSIIANFGKVQALTPYESALEAVLVAATDHSDLLEIVELDEEGKKITGNQEETNDGSEQATAIILAVGSITGKPIPVSLIPKTEKPKLAKEVDSSASKAPATNPEQSASVGSPGRSVQNTIILREVAEDVEEETLNSLFNFEGCPSIESIREDLHNCWFVTFDTSSKDDMFNVMMKLRTTKFPSGDSVKARLKSSASASLLTPNAAVFNPTISSMYAPQFNSNNGGNNNSRKKRSNNKGRNSTPGVGASTSSTNNKSKNNQQTGGSTSKRQNSKDMTSRPTPSNDGAKTRPKKVAVQPPSMGESNFPSLGNSKSFQVEKVPMDDEILRSCEKERHSSAFSDSSSTATTSTASTPTEAPPSATLTGGYAAALLRPAAPVPVAPKKAVTEKPRQQPSSSAKGKDRNSAKKTSKRKEAKTVVDKKPAETSSSVQPAAAAVTVQPPAWGQGRSFADIVSA